MKNLKGIVLIIISFLLLGSLAYLTYLIQDGSNPLSMFNLRASNEEDELDPFLTENDLTSDPVEEFGIPTPLAEESVGQALIPTDVVVAYNSTSPIPTSTDVPVPTITPTEVPGTTNVYNIALINNGDSTEATATPTIIKTLPVSGITDHIDIFLIGGGILILLGLFL